MTGRVNSGLEAVLDLRLRGPLDEIEIKAVIDTGFTDFLLLSDDTLRSLGSRSNEDVRVVLGDGSTVSMDVYPVEVLWDGEWRSARAFAGEGGALIGVSMLVACDLQVRFLPDGEVRVESVE